MELVDLVELEVVVAPKLGVASSHGVGGFQQVVAEIAVAGLDVYKRQEFSDHVARPNAVYALHR